MSAKYELHMIKLKFIIGEADNYFPSVSDRWFKIQPSTFKIHLPMT